MLEAAHGMERHSGRQPCEARTTASARQLGPESSSWRPPHLALTHCAFSIRLARPAREIFCPRCGKDFLAAGPTGFRDDEPICDLCLLEKVEELGVVLALSAVARAFAASTYESRAEYTTALYELGAFARVYEKVAARSGPPRIFRR